MINKSYNLNDVSSMIPVIYNVITRYKEGASAKTVSKEFDISLNDVYKILQDNNIKIRKKNSNEGMVILRTKNKKTRKESLLKEPLEDCAIPNVSEELSEQDLTETNIPKEEIENDKDNSYLYNGSPSVEDIEEDVEEISMEKTEVDFSVEDFYEL